jgi:ribosome-binding protein aMBF1 (putative translation factor)
MLYAAQLRAARSLLGWSQADLAGKAQVGAATIKRIEVRPGLVSGNAETVWKLQKALEDAGIVFINEDDSGGPGVRLRRRLDV